MAKGFIPNDVKEKTSPFKGLYLVAWRYGTWTLKYEGPNQRGSPWANVRYYVFHGTVDEKDAMLKKLRKANEKEGRSLVYMKRITEMEVD